MLRSWSRDAVSQIGAIWERCDDIRGSCNARERNLQAGTACFAGADKDKPVSVRDDHSGSHCDADTPSPRPRRLEVVMTFSNALRLILQWRVGEIGPC